MRRSLVGGQLAQIIEFYGDGVAHCDIRTAAKRLKVEFGVGFKSVLATEQALVF